MQAQAKFSQNQLKRLIYIQKKNLLVHTVKQNYCHLI